MKGDNYRETEYREIISRLFHTTYIQNQSERRSNFKNQDQTVKNEQLGEETRSAEERRILWSRNRLINNHWVYIIRQGRATCDPMRHPTKTAVRKP